MKIEKCPFCGGDAIPCSTGNHFAPEKFFVSCGVCGVETPRIARTRKKAIAAWNRRADVAPVVRGEWVGFDYEYWGEVGTAYACSECDDKTTVKTNYCPNCGAEMEVKP